MSRRWRLPALRGEARRLAPGLALSCLVALAATAVSDHYGGPQLLHALFFGLAFHFLYADPRCRDGVDVAARTLLRLGVALLGARITFSQIAELGADVPIVAAVGAASTIGIGALLARRLGLARRFGVLTGGAVAICGASAALAISSVMPRSARTDREVVLTVVGVTALSTLAMMVYPVLVKVVGLDGTAAGIFLGGTIHDVAQVVAAGLIVSPQAGDAATVVKLFRVVLLVPLVLLLGAFWRRRARRAETAEARPPIVPWFLLAFAALVLLGSVGALPEAAATAATTASRLCLVVAIGALGIKTSFQELTTLGWRPVGLLVAETAWLALFVLAYLLIVRPAVA